MHKLDEDFGIESWTVPSNSCPLGGYNTMPHQDLDPNSVDSPINRVKFYKPFQKVNKLDMNI